MLTFSISRCVALLLASFSVGCFSVAQEWEHKGGFDSIGVQIVPDSVIVRGDDLEFWMQVDASSDEAQNYSKLLMYVRINCQARRFGVVSMVAYLRSGETETAHDEATSMSPIVPDTAVDKVRKALCDT